MGYPALTRWQCARCFSTFEICNAYLVRPEPIVSPFKSRMDEHVCSQWINIIGWIGFLGRFGSITSQVCVFLAVHDYYLVLQRQKITFFFTKMVLVLLPESLLGWRIYKPLSEMGSISNSTDFVSVPNDEYVSLPTNTHLKSFFFPLQAAFFRFLCWIFPSAQICHKLKFCNIITPNNKPPNNKAGKKKKCNKKKNSDKIKLE